MHLVDTYVCKYNYLHATVVSDLMLGYGTSRGIIFHNMVLLHHCHNVVAFTIKVVKSEQCIQFKWTHRYLILVVEASPYDIAREKAVCMFSLKKIHEVLASI